MFFHSVKIEAFCHATEESERVRQAMLELIPQELGDQRFEEKPFKGSFENDILSISIEFTKQSDINCLAYHIKEKLPNQELADFDFDAHVNDGRYFWMRFDKQKALGGEIALGSEDTLQLKGKIAAFPAKRENAVEVMRELWLK